MRRLLLSVALVGLGAGGGYLLAAGRAPAAASVSAARVPAERAAVQVAERGGMSEAALRRVVQEEITAGRAPASATAPAAPAAPAAGDPAAFDRGMQRVHQALAQRRWTADDAAALGRAFETTSAEQRTAVLHALVPALNRGEVKLTYRGDLF